MSTSRLGFLLLLLVLAAARAKAQAIAPATATPDDTNAAPAFNTSHIHPVQQPDQADNPVPAPAPDSSANVDPAKAADFMKRFQQGEALEQQDKLKEALTIYEGILTEQPDAKGSLYHAGVISYELDDLTKADDYLSRLHALVPEFPDATIKLIEINEALKHDVKVELLIRNLQAVHDSGKNPQLSALPLFERERFALGEDEVVISQFYDYHKDPNTVWMAELFSADGKLKRRILLDYDTATTEKLRASDPTKYAKMEVFVWLEHVIKDQRVKELDVYLQIFQRPDYNKFRSAMLLIMANPPKPMLSQPVDVPLDESTQPTTAPAPQ